MSERRSRGGAVVFSPIKRIILIVVLIVLLIGVFRLRSILIDKKGEYAAKTENIASLNDEIAEEDERAKNLKKSNEQVTDDEEIESLARQELGLIKRDEIVIKPR